MKSHKNQLLLPTPVRVIFSSMSQTLASFISKSPLKLNVPFSYRNYHTKRTSRVITILPEFPDIMSQAKHKITKRRYSQPFFEKTTPKFTQMLIEASKYSMLKKSKDELIRCRNSLAVSDSETPSVHNFNFPSRKVKVMNKKQKPTKNDALVDYQAKSYLLPTIIKRKVCIPKHKNQNLTSTKAVSISPVNQKGPKITSIGWLLG